MTRLVRRQGWVAGLLVLFVVLLVITRLIQPGYGSGDFGSLVRAVLPYAFAVAAQTIVVIAGGIDLSVGAMMALTSVTAATMMDGASEEYALFVVPFVLAMGLVLGAVNGMLIVVTRVPDIVVTLATLFVLQGAALLVLGAPGGAVAEWLRATIVGTVSIPGLPEISAWIPKALVLLVVCLCIIWIPLKRSKLGLSIYAIGSSELAAFRSGVPVARTRIIAYALSGLFAAMGGLALTMSTGIGAPIPGPYLLASVAAVVLGGVALGGGKGGLLGPIVAVFVLRLVRTDLTLLAIDPNVTAIIEGAIMVAVVMFGAFITMRSRQS
ncbi:MAG: ABC transporter permease [Mesorhizobium sp.]|uniref:ABC transporter permease n=2 Tax=Mesorhizobium sp. TaxID=1871066 RepID=UPI000FE37F96|nr:ABC transporter permease [Mesorhizobium sp.]RWB03496.1 MAG: ABC transporter permease [Mesorhizobium sp.]RWC04563.1 MAG: ABC transporter permease [Mesorhizobium sp.]RWO12041.1 MAG: ABC transporter permease [Mesorhizobium sp.]RWP07423.1 MAG: ABC transporter permease [Mesorhizobium sp.]RWP23692.1 MAG: ABC transporter permease [Mesorhizobium sp.]